MTAELDRSAWSPAPVFTLIQQLGNISQTDLEATLNQGIGMALVRPKLA